MNKYECALWSLKTCRELVRWTRSLGVPACSDTPVYRTFESRLFFTAVSEGAVPFTTFCSRKNDPPKQSEGQEMEDVYGRETFLQEE